MKNTRLDHPVPIRFSTNTKIRVARVAKRFALRRAEIIRQAVLAQLYNWERGAEIVIRGDAAP